MGQQQNGGARLGAGLATILLAGLGLAFPAVAAAAPQEGIGHSTTPAQPYRGNPDTSDWLGSYVVGGKQVWCVQFAFLAPDSDEQYQPGEALKTKWGTELEPTVAADISYLLLRYANTTSADQAAALAHLLHSWTAGPQSPDQLAPTNDFRHIAYDAEFHLAKLPAGARAAVEALRADATANHGPWTTKITAPTAPLIIGTPAEWTVAVRNAAGRGLANLPVTVTLTDATLADGKATGVVQTPGDGKDLVLAVTPTGPNPTAKIALASPADRPVVRQAIQVDTQRIVSTGGEKELTSQVAVKARPAPGTLKVTKVSASSGAGIAGVTLRLTAADKTKPAIDQNGKPMLGSDGAPAVVVTGADGTVVVPNLMTPQDICVTEVGPPPGFDENFDPAEPPAACGTVSPGATLVLKVANVPNAPRVPVAVPAGDQLLPVASGSVSRVTTPAAVFALCGLLMLLAGIGGVLVRRRIAGRR
jgi:hypothetical protein